MDNRKERYVLTWAGKSEAIQNIQVPSVGTLLPVPEQSIHFDTSENAIIEGDNLEVLKLLQKSYYGKIKMIYIDPPYNTGNEFIYPDNFREGLEEYLRFSGQTDENGIRLSTNAETNGRYHSNWLNMMYPRLFLARNLLKEDGIICISIDDHEIKNLRALLDEIFGEENHVITTVWHRRQNADNRNLTNASTDHEYIVVYQKTQKGTLRGKDIDISKYQNPDNDPRGPWASIDLTGLATKEQRPNLHFDIIDPETGIAYPPNPARGWSKSKETIDQMIQNNEILFPKNPNGRPRQKKFLRDLQSSTTGFSSILKDVGFTTDGTREVTELLGERIFAYPKPTELIKTFIDQCTGENDIVLDFFAGSGTTAQAVLELNRQDGGNRKFILVQLPEPIDRQDYPTIVEITKERVRRVIAKINQEEENELDLADVHTQDRGFKVFKLSSSNFKIWDGSFENIPNAQVLVEQLTLFADNVQPGRSKLDMLYEILLKSGFQLSERIAPVLALGETVYSVADGSLLVCLAETLTEELVRGMIELEPDSVICLDSAFHGNDPLKTNAVLEMKSHDIEFRTV
ncbi:site-specific DNA-methyltransferase [Brevibacillus composti]|uniref:Site-specific DNA-methyltransferase n=1 Tax=Brevibacillus composti TaxID=2796470 RepID=A0A7T5EM37_9BACL|nr:site-specific DNA-methyltransferase [Brevibacillus composti]QQE75053.1 site-specific DNA-methyltransferase [Brevibacillus composti]QUO42139.1 site-specific DNA-methyltransferase [Brevibacillus composti]